MIGKIIKIIKLIIYIVAGIITGKRLFIELYSKPLDLVQYVIIFSLSVLSFAFLFATISWFLCNLRWCKYCHHIRWVHIESYKGNHSIICNTCNREIDYIDTHNEFDQDAMP